MERYFATEREIKSRCVAVKKSEKSDACGPMLLSDDYVDYIVPEEGHVMCFGGTGSGKTTRILLPTIEKIARCGESLIVVDPKPELICRTQSVLKANGYRMLYLNFIDYWKSQRYNLLQRVKKLYDRGERSESFKLLDEIGTALFHEHINNSKDPYFGMNGRDLFVGIGMALLEAGEYLTLESISVALAEAKDSFATSDYMTEYIKLRGAHSEAAMRMAGRAYAPKDTASCIDSVAATVLNPYVMDSLSDMMCQCDFDFAGLAYDKVAIFIITPGDDSCMETYVGLLVKQAYDDLKEIALKQENGKLPKTVHFMIDEFCNFSIPSIERMITLARGYNERFYLGIQNYGSLSAKYGADTASTIWANSEIKYILRSSDIQLGEMLEHLCGTRIDAVSGQQRPLIGVTDIQRLDKEHGEAIILVDGLRPFVTRFDSIYDHEWEYPYFSINQLPVRKPVERSHFDFQAMVKDMKRKNLFEKLAPLASNSPLSANQMIEKAERMDTVGDDDGPEDGIILPVVDEDFEKAIDAEFNKLFGQFVVKPEEDDLPLP